MAQAQLTETQRESMKVADQEGRVFVTQIEGHVALVLPSVPEETKKQQAARLLRIIENFADEALWRKSQGRE